MRLFDVLFIDFYIIEPGSRFLEWVIKNHSEKSGQSELEEIGAQLNSYLDFYEVQQVQPGKGSYLKSLYTKNEFFLNDVSSSKKLVKWDIIFSRCYQYKRRFYSTGTLTIFNLAEKEYILERINSEYAKYKEQNEEKNYAAFAKNNWEFFFKIEREIFKPEKDKKFYSNHGVLQLYEIRFQVNDLQTALSKIREPEEFNFTGSAIRKLKKNVLSATSLNGWQWVLKQN